MKIHFFVLAATLCSFASALSGGATFKFEYGVKLSLLREGSNIRLWIPHPIEDVFQSVNNTSIDSTLSWRVTKEKKYGNKMLYLDGKVPSKDVEVKVTYEITRKEISEQNRKLQSANRWNDPRLYLIPDSKGPLTDTIRKMASNEVEKTQQDKTKILRLYDFIVKTMRYDKSGTGWGNGDAVWACDSKRGNCTDFHSLFIAMSRSVSVPARFYIGFPIRPDLAEGEIPGYHCWAEAYAKEAGWIPVDASEAKKSGNSKQYFGQLPADRIAFSMGRDLVLEPPQSKEPLNYFIYPYAEIDGQPLEKISKRFYFKRL